MGKRMPIYGWGAPLGGLIALIFGQRDAALMLVAGWMAASVCTFSAFDALRRAAAGAMSDEKLGRMARSALLTLIPAAVLLGFAEISRDTKMILAAALVLTIPRCAQAILEAKGDRVSLILTDVLTAIAVSAALLSASTARERGIACILAAALPALLSLAFILPVLINGWKLSGAFFREIPLALLRNLPWPLLASGIAWMATGGALTRDRAEMAAGFLIGCLILELTRPMFRRRDGEGMGQRLSVAMAALLASAGGFLLAETVQGGFSMAWDALILILPALGCSLWVYGPAHWETILAGGLLILPPAGVALAGFLGRQVPEHLILPGCCALALAVCCLMASDWGRLHRQIRANRMRRRARKRAARR